MVLETVVVIFKMLENIVYPPLLSKKMKRRFDNLLLCVDASGLIHSCRAYDKEWDFQTRVIWLRINGMGPLVIAELFDLNVNTVKNREFLGLLTSNYKNRNYKLCEVIMSAKTKAKTKKTCSDPEWRKANKLRAQLLAQTPEWIRRQQAGVDKMILRPEYREQRRLNGERIRNDPEHGKKVSAGYQHIPYDEWESFASNSLYCPKFNEECREANRNKYNRRCFICNLSEEENITSTGKWQRLSVHHVDMDKMQGCDGKRWKLVPVCIKHHSLLHNELWMSRIIWLLDNVWCEDRLI